MSVSSGDILEYESASTGSTGGAITGSTITSGILDNVWTSITDAERIAGIIEYRKTFWKNTHATDDMVLPVIFAPIPPTNAAFVIGLGLNSSDDDDPTLGNMSAFAAPAQVALVSSSADARIATIYGLDNSGSPVPTIETVTLNGTSEVLSVATFSKVWRVDLASLSGVTVTVKQGSGGTTRGSIPPSKKGCWLWVTAGSKGAGIALPNLPAGQNYGVWRRLTVAAGAGAVRPNTLRVRIEENS